MCLFLIYHHFFFRNNHRPQCLSSENLSNQKRKIAIELRSKIYLNIFLFFPKTYTCTYIHTYVHEYCQTSLATCARHVPATRYQRTDVQAFNAICFAQSVSLLPIEIRLTGNNFLRKFFDACRIVGREVTSVI